MANFDSIPLTYTSFLASRYVYVPILVFNIFVLERADRL